MARMRSSERSEACSSPRSPGCVAGHPEFELVRA